MKPAVLVTREVFDEVLAFLGEHFEVEANQDDTPLGADELAARLANKAGALTTIGDRVDEVLLARCPRLRAVCNIAVGFNNFDLAACTKHGVMATHTPGVLDDSTADFTWALILAAARRVGESERYLRAGQWRGWKLKQFLGTDVHHATLGILGMGRIGRKVARRAHGFDMRVIYHNTRRLPEDVERACNASYVGMEELLARSDILSVHTPYSPATHHLVGADEFAQMKDGVVFVHASRGGVVDDAALVAALRSGKIGAAGLDVYEGEPRLNAELLEFENAVLTPHIASSSEATRRDMAMLAARNLVAALAGAAPPNLLNPDVQPSVKAT